MLKLLPYLYLARVPILTALALVLLTPVALWSPTASLLGGLYDLKPWGLFFVALSSLLLAWTIMITLWLVAVYGYLRFGTGPTGLQFPPPQSAAIGFGLLAIPLWLGVFVTSDRKAALSIALLLGIAAAATILFVVNAVSQREYFARGRAIPRQLRMRAQTRALTVPATEAEYGKATPGRGLGYLDRAETAIRGGFPLLNGHGLAIAMFISSFLVYAGVGLCKFLLPGDNMAVPSLAYVLLLLMVGCWGLAGITFFLDRYRVPAILLLGTWWTITSFVFPSDHYYSVFPENPPQLLSPKDLILRGTTNRVIVVATTGGGIQSAAWTAKVLEGLEDNCRNAKSGPCATDRQFFSKSVRLISSVSGGSVGAMYFANEYDPNGGGIHGPLLAFDAATRSSLDDVAWGLVYPDFFRTLMYLPWHTDRGRALEKAWIANSPQQLPALSGGMAWWRDGANSGARPAVIFNSTISETGQRLLLSTSGMDPKGDATQTFSELGGGATADLGIATAARLSSTFPFVTPMARSDGDLGHMADGGYYDNYGMSTLIQWLSQALPLGTTPLKDVLVLQIRGFPPDELREKTRRGWLYQTYAPIATMFHVRTAGQFAHNQDEFRLLQEALKPAVTIHTAVFQFCGTDPPLSWHLTQSQTEALKKQWGQSRNDQAWQTVEHFLEGNSTADDTQEPAQGCETASLF
jgi:hypothetical protein